MILFALATILILFYLYDDAPFPFILTIYFVFFDMFDGFYKDDKIFSVIRYVLPLILIFIYATKNKAFKTLDSIFVVLLGYLVILWIVNPGDILVTSRMMLSLIITLIMIPIGKCYAENNAKTMVEPGQDLIARFEKYNRFLLIAIPLYIVYANKVGIAGFYTESFSTGYLITSRIYIIPIVVFFAIHYSLDDSTNKSLWLRATDVAFILFNVCIVLINTRRTALLMLVGAIFVYLMYNRKLIFKMVTLLGVVIAGLILSYPLYADRLKAQLEKRERIEHLDSYEEEGRYLETLYIIDYHQRHNNLAEMFYGIKLFDTYDFGLVYFRRDRPIHSDINMIFFSTGFIGLILFLLFFIHFFLIGNKKISSRNKKLYFPILVMFLIVLIPGRFIGTLTYSPLLMFLLAGFKAEPEFTEEVELNEYREEEYLNPALLTEEAGESPY